MTLNLLQADFRFATAIFAFFAAVLSLAFFIHFHVLDNSLHALVADGAIRIGYAVEAPYAFITNDGQVTGEAPEIARIVASRLAIKNIIWRQSEFSSLLDELEAGRIDVIAAGMFITPERMLRASFSRPTVQVRQGLLVSRGNPSRLESYQQLASLTTTQVAVLAGSFEEKILKELGIPQSRIKIVPDALTGRVAVETGVVDALALSAPTVKWMAKSMQLGKTQAAEPFFQPDGLKPGLCAFAFRHDDTQLLTAWNHELENFLGCPEHQRLVDRFGFSREELPECKKNTENRIR